MTGRKGRVVKNENGEVIYESRCQGDSQLERVNMDEKERFMNGEKLIAIISEAASNGKYIEILFIWRFSIITKFCATI